jgi:hypothetical protein
MSKQQTAVDWLIEQLQKTRDWQRVINEANESSSSVRNVIKEAKEMDREQKKHAYDWGETNGADECNGDGATHENFEQYYQETYGGNK